MNVVSQRFRARVGALLSLTQPSDDRNQLCAAERRFTDCHPDEFVAHRCCGLKFRFQRRRS